MLLTPVDIIVDSREASKHPEVVKEFKKRGLAVAVQALEAGDYYLLAAPGKKPLLIERKTVNDLLNSIRDNRIWEQTILLKESASKDGLQPLLVIEGWMGVIEKYRQWRIQSVLRVLDTIMLEYNVPVLYTPSLKATVEWIIAKARSLGETRDKKVFRMRTEKKPMSLYEKILYVAEGFAGPTLARKLLRHFKTLKAIANASIAELTKVEGIGEKRAMEIYSIFNTPWREDKVQR